jgi:TPR repeat protein
LAVKLISGQDTGSISLEDVRERALGARAEAAEEQFNRAFRALTMQLSLSADEDAESLEKKAAALEASLAKMNEIFDEYPSTELSGKQITGQEIGQTALEGFRLLAKNKRREAAARPKFEKTFKAAEQGDAEAQYNVGLMYHTGEGIPQNYTEAVKWYRKAAEQGHAKAQNNLGVMYLRGTGVPANAANAYMWI